jgi:nucleotide-binding universal stress UspA family protein
VECEHRLLFGEPGSVSAVKPADAILKLAQDENVDMIVIGTHGRAGLLRLVMGSVAQQVLNGATCPVVTVKHKSEA